MSNILKYGIDFGTTNSSISIIDTTDPDFPRARVLEVDRYESPFEILRSVVAYKGSDIFVGNEGLEQVLGSEDNPARQVKLDLLNAQKDGYCFTYNGKKIYYSDIMGEIFRRLRVRAETQIGSDKPDGVIVGVPYETPADVKNVYITALIKAGFYCDLETAYANTEFLEEPVAVAIFYGTQIAHQNRYSLVVDYGGGTMDMAIVRLNSHGEKHEIIAKEGYEGAGEKMTALLFSKVFLPAYAERYFEGNRVAAMKVFKKMGYNARTLDGMWNELGKTGGLGWKFINELDRAKQKLSTESECVFAFHVAETDYNPEIRIDNVVLKRAEFEEAISSELEEIGVAVNRMFASKKCKINDITKSSIDEVLLAGGSSIIPSVREKLADIFGKEKIHFDETTQGGYLINVMTGISQGLAWFGYRPDHNMRVDDITSFDYGIYDRINDRLEVVLEKGTKLSAASASLFTGHRLPPENYVYYREIYHKDKDLPFFYVEITEGDRIVKTLHFNKAKHSGCYRLFFAIDERRGLIEVHVYDTINAEWIEDLPLGDRSIEMRE